MDLKKAVVIKTFSNLAEAQMTQIDLESMGIDTYLKKDDVGGGYPSLRIAQGVQLLVNSEDLSKAEQIIEELEEENIPKIKNQVGTSKYQGWGILVLGIVFGMLLAAIGYMFFYEDHNTLNGKVGYDTNRDGKDDMIYWYSHGSVQKIENDRNHDGNSDLWRYYESNKITRIEFDNNFDGKIDGRSKYKDRFKFTSEFDSDFDGLFDVSCFYTNGVKDRIDWHPGGSKTIERRELYTYGIKTQELKDTDKDDVFDLKISFDPYGNEIVRENIQ